MTNVFIGNGVTSIGYGAFWGSGLTSVNIPDSVTEISDSAFRECDNLEEITIGSNVKTIGRDAFNYCDNLKMIYCKPIIPPTVDIDVAFSPRLSFKAFYVPTESVEAYKTADKWKHLASKIVGYDF